MRITSKGQITIPIEIREKMGFLSDTESEKKFCAEGIKVPKITRTKNHNYSAVK